MGHSLPRLRWHRAAEALTRWHRAEALTRPIRTAEQHTSEQALRQSCYWSQATVGTCARWSVKVVCCGGGSWVGVRAEPRANELVGAPGSGPEATGPGPTSAMAYFRSGSPLSFCLPLFFVLCADILSVISIDFPLFVQ